MRDSRARFTKVAAVGMAVAVVLSVLAPVGMAAPENLSVSQSETAVTAAPGENVTLTTTMEATNASAPRASVQLPGNWSGSIADYSSGGSPKPPIGTANVLEVIWLGAGTHEVTYEVQVPADAAPGEYAVDATGSVIDPSSGGFVNETAATTITVEGEPTESTSPDFRVSGVDVPGNVTRDDTVDASAEITNAGGQSDTQTVEFRLDADRDATLEENETLGAENVTLDAGASASVDLAGFGTTDLAPGTYVYAVITANDSTTGVINVTEGESEPEPDAATFEASNLTAPANVTQGDLIDVSADVTNTGETNGTQTVALLFDVNGDGQLSENEVAGATEVALDANESTTVTFQDRNTSTLAPGEYAYGVFTANDSATGVVTVTEGDPDPDPKPDPATFEVSGLTAPDSVAQSESFDASVTVSNAGDENGTQTVGLRVDADGDGELSDDETVRTREIALDAGESTTISAEDVNTSDLEPGEYTYGVFTANDSATGAITITSDESEPEPEPEPEPGAATFEVSDLTAPDKVAKGEAFDASVTIANVGDESGTQAVELRAAHVSDGDLTGDDPLRTWDVSLDAGESTTITAEDVDTSGLKPGKYRYGVFTANDSATGTIVVTGAKKKPEPEPGAATFEVSDLTAPDTVTRGEKIDASVTVTNTGETDGTQTVALRADADGELSDDETVRTREVALDAGESTTITAEDVDTGSLAPGEYAYGVFTDNDSVTDTLTVEAKQDDGDDARYYQVDLVRGEPLEELGPADSDNFYSDQARLIQHMHGSTEDPVTRRGRPSTLDSDTSECVADETMEVDGDTASVTVTVEEGCELTVSMVSYDKPDAGWSREMADQQELIDSTTKTLGPGTHELTVELPTETDE